MQRKVVFIAIGICFIAHLSFASPELKRAVIAGNLDEVRRLVNAGADVNFTDYLSSPIISLAAFWGFKDIVEFLLQQPGIEINKISDTRYGGAGNALGAAASGGRFDVVELLLRQPNIDLNIKGSMGTPLMVAVTKGHFPMVVALISAGANKGVGLGGRTALEGRTALDMARAKLEESQSNNDQKKIEQYKKIIALLKQAPRVKAARKRG